MTWFTSELKGHGTGSGNANGNPLMSPRTGGHAAFGNSLQFSPHLPITGHGSGSGNCNGNLSPRLNFSLSLFSNHQSVNQNVTVQTGASAGQIAAVAMVCGAAIAAGAAASIALGESKEERAETAGNDPYASTIATQMMRQRF